jgi:glucosamine kinase
MESIVQKLQFFLGVDGGGTGCRARLADDNGKVIGQGVSGPANLTLGIPIVLTSLMEAARLAYVAAGVDERAMAVTHAGLGMAAANVPRHRQALENTPLPFASVAVRSDAETACLGAHGGADGGVLILGTGSQGVVFVNGTFHTVAGWGFAVSDDGSGALLGRAAVRRAFLAHDCIEPATALTAAIMRSFNSDLSVMLDWAATATPRDWAAFAKMVFQYTREEDATALELIRESAHQTQRMLDRMRKLGARRVALMGGLAEPILPYLAPQSHAGLVLPQGDALDGAMWLARQSASLRAAQSGR